MNRSVTNAINILEELAKFKKPVALRELARSTNLDKATTYRLLNSLWQKGLVQKTGDHGCYGLGAKLLAFAEEYRQSFTMRDTVVPYLEELVRVIGETAIYCERFQHNSCVTIERRESPHDTRTVIQTGIPRPLYVGSSALAILAMLPHEEILSILSVSSLEQFTPLTVTSQMQLIKTIEEIKKRGYAVSIQQYTVGVAAPCYLDRSVTGSIAVIGPAPRIEAGGIEKTGRIVKEIANRLSTELGSSKRRQNVGCSR